MKKIVSSFIFCFLLLNFSSCLRLDNNLFNPYNNITEYKLDDFTEYNEIDLDTSYDIVDSLIHIFSLTSNDGIETAQIQCIYIGDFEKIKTDTIIMYCHGNTGHMDYYWDRAKLLANVGNKNRFGVLMLDYRGFGLSTGVSSENGMYADVDACLNWLAQQGLTSDRLAMYGFSLGSAPATELTANPRSLTPSWLILEAPFASAEVMAQDASRLSMPGSYFTNLKIDNATEIKKIAQPFLWLHGSADKFLSMKTHGEVVYKNYTGKLHHAHRVKDAGHSNLPLIMGFTSYIAAIDTFLLSK